MKKSLFFYIIIIFAILGLGCKTTPNVYTAISGTGGQLVFIRPVDFGQINPVIKKASVDVTLHIKNQTLEQNAVCNYTLTLGKTDLPVAEQIEVALVWQNGGQLSQISALKKELLFKQMSGSKAQVRFSLEFDKNDFLPLLKSSEPVKVLFKTPNLYDVRFENEVFNKQIDEVRLLIN